MRHREYREHERPALYRSRNGCIFGVCRGISDSYGFSLFWTRVLFVISSMMTGLWPAIGVYIVAALMMKMEPILPLETDEDEEFYHAYTTSRAMALSRLKRTFDNLDRRIQRLETTVTTREYDWDRRLNN
jgi:phage shock protein C